MPIKVQVGPPHIAIHQVRPCSSASRADQLAERQGSVFPRTVNSWAIHANGEPWELLNRGAVSYCAARIFLTNKSIATEYGAIDPRTLGLTIGRSAAAWQ
jgi:hypothetical protein